MDSEVVVRRKEGDEVVTYLAGPRLAEDLGIHHSTLCYWKNSGQVRHRVIRGKHYCAVADATILLYETPEQTVARTGKLRSTRKHRESAQNWTDKTRKRLEPNATRRGEVWEATEVERVKEMFLAGQREDAIAERLGRTYAGVLGQVCKLRKDGELPPMTHADVEAALMKVGKHLTDAETVRVMDAMIGKVTA